MGVFYKYIDDILQRDIGDVLQLHTATSKHTTDITYADVFLTVE